MEGGAAQPNADQQKARQGGTVLGTRWAIAAAGQRSLAVAGVATGHRWDTPLAVGWVRQQVAGAVHLWERSIAVGGIRPEVEAAQACCSRPPMVEETISVASGVLLNPPPHGESPMAMATKA